MQKTRKIVSMVLVAAMIAAMITVGIAVTGAATGNSYFIANADHVDEQGNWIPDDEYILTRNTEQEKEEYYIQNIYLEPFDYLEKTGGFKVAKSSKRGTSFQSWFPDGVDNNVTVPKAGYYDIYFRPNADGEEDWYYVPTDAIDGNAVAHGATVGGLMYYIVPCDTEEPTEATADEPTEAAPEEPTDAPEEPTDAPAQGSIVKIDNVEYNVHVGDTIHYAYYLDLTDLPKADGGMTGRATEVQGSVFFDPAMLKVTTNLSNYEDGNGYEVNDAIPNLKGGAEISNDTAGKVGYNGYKATGYDFSSKKVLIQLDFEVIGEGSSEIVNQFKSLGSGTVVMIQNSEVFEAPVTETVADVECPHTEPTEAPTEEPVVEPTEAPTEEPTASGKNTVTIVDWDGTETVKEVSVGEKLTVTTYFKQPEGKRLEAFDIWETFNVGTTTLQLDSSVENDTEEMFPNMKSITANVEDNTIKANFSTAKHGNCPEFPNDDSVLMTAKYTVVEAGESKIVITVKELATIPADDSKTTPQISENQVVGTDVFTLKTVFYEAPAVEPTEPATSYIVGDVNLSGEVDNRDAMILDRYIAGWADYDRYIKNMDAADMDRKGTVDNRDAMILDRVVAGWPGYYEKYCITVNA